MLSFLGGLLFLISTLRLMNWYWLLNSWLYQNPMRQFHCFPLSWILSLNESRYNCLLLVKICWQLPFTKHASYASSWSEPRGAFWLVDGWGAEALESEKIRHSTAMSTHEHLSARMALQFFPWTIRFNLHFLFSLSVSSRYPHSVGGDFYPSHKQRPEPHPVHYHNQRLSAATQTVFEISLPAD